MRRRDYADVLDALRVLEDDFRPPADRAGLAVLQLRLVLLRRMMRRINSELLAGVREVEAARAGRG